MLSLYVICTARLTQMYNDPVTHISVLQTQVTTSAIYFTFKGGADNSPPPTFPHFSSRITKGLKVMTAFLSEDCSVTAGSGSGAQRRSKLLPT